MKPTEYYTYDYIVVGSGVAGMWTSLNLADDGRVALLTKDELQNGSTRYAQGGIAVAMAEDDDPELHLRDTLEAGDGLCDVPAVEVLTFDGPKRVRELIEAGVHFDRDNDHLSMGREAAHSHRRIIHSEGDATGAVISRELGRNVREHDNIDVLAFTMVTDILKSGDRCVGVQAFDLEANRHLMIAAKATALATGGVGAIFRVTTNPDVVTGDGIATAFRAGIPVKDMEFVQFHPTALAAPGFPKFLMSEALRGDGARLVDESRHPFMEEYHSMGDLAPRDEVSRAVIEEMQKARQPFVYLDLKPIGERQLEKHFPNIAAECREKGFDVPDEPVPVAPVAHYFMGGIDADMHCETILSGLHAVGECACLSVHGANRLASNSLLEGIVYGPICATSMKGADPLDEKTHKKVKQMSPESVTVGRGFFHDLRDIMWDNVGIIRSNATLARAQQYIENMRENLTVAEEPTRSGIEGANALLVARLISTCAGSRYESRGAHHRVGYSRTYREMRKHTIVHISDGGEPVIEHRPVDQQRVRDPLS
ncbi:MAG: L-aspartate oxidase [Armatimonadota bacterium]